MNGKVRVLRIKKNVLMFKWILSTNVFKECMDISLEKLSVDIVA